MFIWLLFKTIKINNWIYQVKYKIMQEDLKISIDKIRKEKEKMLKKIKDTDILLVEILNYISLIS